MEPGAELIMCFDTFLLLINQRYESACEKRLAVNFLPFRKFRDQGHVQNCCSGAASVILSYIAHSVMNMQQIWLRQTAQESDTEVKPNLNQSHLTRSQFIEPVLAVVLTQLWLDSYNWFHISCSWWHGASLQFMKASLSLNYYLTGN